MTSSHLDSILKTLAIPPEYGHYDKLVDHDVLARLDRWKANIDDSLVELRDLVNHSSSQFSISDQAVVVSIAAAFQGDAPWNRERARELADEILASFVDPPSSLLDKILTDHVKNIFKFNPHPSLNLSTGRRLPENAAGSMASQDYYDGQVWKQHPGAPNVVSWCVRNTRSSTYEDLWHLIIPPVMTLLDDYEANYKLHGIRIVFEMLERVPNDLLRRTGVDGLFFTSLTIALTNLHNPLTPSILRAATRATLALIDLSAPPGSQARFDKLCALLGDGIIGNVWMYASRDPDSIQATLDMLPDIIEKLGIGCARYLKAIIPQLTHPLLLKLVASSMGMQLASLRAISALIHACPPRMHRWKGTILEAVAKCWVGIIDLDMDDPSIKDVEEALRCVCSELGKTCPSMSHDEYTKLVSLDPIFRDLVE